ncbi:MAG: transposase, partial [Bryobacteraceae bacterium]
LAAELRLMDQPRYQLDEPSRQAVLEAIVNRCTQSDWNLRAAHVRQSHVHIIVDSQQKPGFVMTQLKSAASRRLNDLGFDDRTRKRWSRHGSTRSLFSDESIQQAIFYVLHSQGAPWRFSGRTAPEGRGSSRARHPNAPSPLTLFCPRQFNLTGSCIRP